MADKAVAGERPTRDSTYGRMWVKPERAEPVRAEPEGSRR
jgi:hypothetical protein